jgi:hypothetical protein
MKQKPNKKFQISLDKFIKADRKNTIVNQASCVKQKLLWMHTQQAGKFS